MKESNNKSIQPHLTYLLKHPITVYNKVSYTKSKLVMIIYYECVQCCKYVQTEGHQMVKADLSKIIVLQLLQIHVLWAILLKIDNDDIIY